MDFMRRAAAVYESVEDLNGAAGARLGIGFALEADSRLHEALVENQHALALARAAGNVTLEVHALNNSADTLVALKDTDLALQLLEDALKLAQSAGERQHEALITSSIGQLCIDRQDYQRALEYLHEALRQLRELGFRTVEGDTLMRIGVALRAGRERADGDPWGDGRAAGLPGDQRPSRSRRCPKAARLRVAAATSAGHPALSACHPPGEETRMKNG